MKALFVQNCIRGWVFNFILVGIFLIPILSSAQSKINIAIGADIWEGYNASIRYQTEQSQLALGVGKSRFIYGHENDLNISASFFYHFHGVSNFTTRRIWYGKMSIIYSRFQEYVDGPEMDGLTFGVRFGRDFNLSKRVALSADIGLNYGTADSVKIPLFGAGICLLYRI
ncbi:MAG: hypothetical protein IPN97_07160 [Saprospiraceae bacterium]|nr:hypothetical protein [Saprospiraceae bacterium]